MRLNIFDKLKVNKDTERPYLYKYLVWFLAFMGVLLAAGIVFPTAVSLILNVFWIVLLTIVIVFFSLGLLVILGLRKEAARILDVLLEGSLTIIDFIEFLKLVYKRFIEILIEFILIAAPVLAYIVGFLIYLLLLMVYKYIGSTYDVTVLTIVLTSISVLSVGFLTKPKEIQKISESWRDDFKKKFRMAFTDSLEVMLFLFFITMDSTNLFFLPDNLNVELEAEVGDYNLMLRGFTNNHTKITLNLIIFSIITEIIRNAMRLIATARKYYAEGVMSLNPGENYTRINLIKSAIRQSFTDTKDDIVKFITFTTILMAVFILFPRLKLLTLAIASFTSFILDIAYPSRLTVKRGDDLINRLLAKAFRL